MAAEDGGDARVPPDASEPNPLEPLTRAEQEELARLRKEVRRLREDRDILRRAAAFFGVDTSEER